MKYCSNCQVTVKGKWEACPLCSHILENRKDMENIKSDFIKVPLLFNREKARREFLWTALAIILLYIVTSFIYDFQFFGFRYVVFGLLITWIVTFVLLRK